MGHNNGRFPRSSWPNMMSCAAEKKKHTKNMQKPCFLKSQKKDAEQVRFTIIVEQNSSEFYMSASFEGCKKLVCPKTRYP
jgi:hypothetical protein